MGRGRRARPSPESAATIRHACRRRGPARRARPAVRPTHRLDRVDAGSAGPAGAERDRPTRVGRSALAAAATRSPRPRLALQRPAIRRTGRGPGAFGSPCRMTAAHAPARRSPQRVPHDASAPRAPPGGPPAPQPASAHKHCRWRHGGEWLVDLVRDRGGQLAHVVITRLTCASSARSAVSRWRAEASSASMSLKVAATRPISSWLV